MPLGEEQNCPLLSRNIGTRRGNVAQRPTVRSLGCTEYDGGTGERRQYSTHAPGHSV